MLAGEAAMQATKDARDGGAEDAYPAATGAWTLVALLTFANVLSFVDRQILSLLVDPIRATMGISDVQVSLLIGPAFALFFCLAALPLGRMVDTRGRVRLAAIGVVLWSLATFLSGFAGSFGQLFAARRRGRGRGRIVPRCQLAHRGQLSPEPPRPRIGVFALAIYLGSGLALLFGGAVVGWAEHGGARTFSGRAPWQLVLLLVGAPGLLVGAALVLIPEPARRGLGATTGSVSLGAARRYMAARGGVFLTYFLSFGTFVLGGYAVLAWAPTHLVRTMAVTRAEAGLGLGMAVMLGGLVGIGGATTLADRLATRGALDGKFRIAAAACAINAALAVLLGLAHHAGFYIALIGLMTACNSAGIALGPAALGEIAPGEMRGQALALYPLVATVVGAGVGPPLVALLAKHAGVPIGVALAIVVAVASVLGAIGFLTGRARFGREVDRLSLAVHSPSY